MSKRDLYDDSQQPTHSFGRAPSENTSDSFSDLFSSVDPSEFEFEEDENAYYHHPRRLSQEDPSQPDVQDNEPEDAPQEASQEIPQEEPAHSDFRLGDYTDYDSYSDSGTYRSYDGSSEYRSFDAAMPDAPEEGWYHYSDEDSDLEDADYDDDYEEDDEDYDDRPSGAHRALKVLSHILLIFP